MALTSQHLLASEYMCMSENECLELYIFMLYWHGFAMDVLQLFLTIKRDILSPFILTDSNDWHEKSSSSSQCYYETQMSCSVMYVCVCMYVCLFVDTRDECTVRC